MINRKKINRDDFNDENDRRRQFHLYLRYMNNQIYNDRSQRLFRRNDENKNERHKNRSRQIDFQKQFFVTYKSKYTFLSMFNENKIK